jgi:hypothetical protein
MSWTVDGLAGGLEGVGAGEPDVGALGLGEVVAGVEALPLGGEGGEDVAFGGAVEGFGCGDGGVDAGEVAIAAAIETIDLVGARMFQHSLPSFERGELAYTPAPHSGISPGTSPSGCGTVVSMRLGP